MSEIRLATAADAPACAAILQSWLDATPWMPKLHNYAETEGFCRDVLIGAQRAFVVGDPPAAFLAMLPDTGIVSALYAAQGARSQGFGKGLLDRAKAESDMLELWTFAANGGAQRFYEREGFIEIRRTEGENDERLPDILYRWSREARQ
jgi:putative acetyltransferase